MRCASQSPYTEISNLQTLIQVQQKFETMFQRKLSNHHLRRLLNLNSELILTWMERVRYCISQVLENKNQYISLI